MKKGKKIVILIVVCLLLFGGICKVKAAQVSEYSYSTSTEGNEIVISYSSGTNSIISIIIYVISILISICSPLILPVYLILRKRAEKKELDKCKIDIEGSNTNFDLDKIKEVLPDFDIEVFRDRVYQIYKDIQVAWMNLDLDKIKPLVTDKMYDMYKNQVKAFKTKDQVNVMKDFELTKFRITNMDCIDYLISIDVYMQIEMIDYIENKDSIVKGDKDRKVVYDYKMTFNKALGENANECPNCGAELDLSTSNICSYCRTQVIDKNYDWILAKKKVINQSYK